MTWITISQSIAGALFSLCLAAVPAGANSLQTFVSGKGVDAGGCATPAKACRTFAFAITQTAASGAIIAIDPANYGPVTITQSISIVVDGSRFCPPLFQRAVQPLACYVYDHLLGVGNASAIAIPKGTPISFAAKLVNAGAYCATVPAPEPIPPHLSVVITGQPLFDDQAPCQAWREVPPVFKQ